MISKFFFPGAFVLKGPVKSYGYLFFALILLISSWETQSALASENKAIPDQAIRIRILAHSDAPPDQWVKRRVTDAVVAHINGWAPSLQTVEQAREKILEHTGDIENIARHELERYGFPYGVRVELARVPFPEKVFWGLKYGEGDYETLRITLGEGKGSNWWCVVFPPLCFTDLVFKKEEPDNALSGKESAAAQNAQPVEIRFFVVELWKKVENWVKNVL